MFAAPQVTNADRAAWAEEALATFTDIVYDSPDVEDMETRIKDLIVNLLHLARREAGVTDVAAFAAQAVEMHNVECAEDPEGDDEEDE